MTAPINLADVLRVTPAEAISNITMCMQTKLVPMLWGDPGIGKSDIYAQIAKKFKLKLIDVRLSQYDQTDMHGFPSVAGRRSTYLPMDTFPLDDDEIPDGYSGWLILLDEFSSAPRAVLAAAYKFILDRMVGNRNLHPNAIIGCAGNLMTSGAIVNNIGTASQTRLVHFELKVSPAEWELWASAHKLAHEVISYIHATPTKLQVFDPEHNDKTFACPRSWEFASRIMLYKKMPLRNKRPALAGTIGQGIAYEFLTYCEVYGHIPTYEQIRLNPSTIEITDEPSMLAALAGSVGAHLTVADLPQVMKYIDRLPMEFQLFSLRDACKRNPLMVKEKEISKWLTVNSMELY